MALRLISTKQLQEPMMALLVTSWAFLGNSAEDITFLEMWIKRVKKIPDIGYQFAK